MTASLKSFFLALQIIFSLEGGWYAGDGGTMYGIRASTLGEANRRGIVRETNIRRIKQGDAAKIYYYMYWIPSGAGRYDWPLCLVVFDAAVHNGVGKSGELLDIAYKALRPGSSQNDIALQMVVERWKHLKSLSKFPKYPGWRRRMNTILRHVLDSKEQRRKTSYKAAPPLPLAA